jgi:Tol biopolymer transport system component
MRLVLSFFLLLVMGVGFVLARPLPDADPAPDLLLTATLTSSPYPTRPALIFSANGRPAEMYSDAYGTFQLYNTFDLDAPLTPDDANAFDSRVSPDGSQVIYTRREGEGLFAVMVMDVDGRNHTRLTDGKTPDWSPDGAQIAFSREDGVYLMDADGADVQQIATDLNIYDLRFTPDGERLLLTVTIPDVGSRARTLDLDSGDLQPLSGLDEDTPVYSVAMAPDGEGLAWANADGLFISPDGGGTQQRAEFQGLFSDMLNDDGYSVSDLRWSPDGRYLAFALYSWRLTVAISTPVPVDRVGAQIAIYDTETQQLRVLTRGFENGSPDWLLYPTPTPAP